MKPTDNSHPLVLSVSSGPHKLNLQPLLHALQIFQDSSYFSKALFFPTHPSRTLQALFTIFHLTEFQGFLTTLVTLLGYCYSIVYDNRYEEL